MLYNNIFVECDRQPPFLSGRVRTEKEEGKETTTKKGNQTTGANFGRGDTIMVSRTLEEEVNNNKKAAEEERKKKSSIYLPCFKRDGRSRLFRRLTYKSTPFFPEQKLPSLPPSNYP